MAGKNRKPFQTWPRFASTAEVAFAPLQSHDKDLKPEIISKIVLLKNKLLTLNGINII